MRLWYTTSSDEVLKGLNTSDSGLSTAETSKRQRQYGFNELRTREESFWKKVIEPFSSIFILILLFAAIFSFIGHESLDGTIIIIIVLINSTIFYVQRHSTQRILNSLKKHSQQIVQVVRDGRTIKLASRLLVPGDIIVLSEGEKIPADSRLLSLENLFVDESALTGESLPINKSSSVITGEKQLYEQFNMVFQGTYVISGTARAVVVATGLSTEFGKIAELATKAEPKSPMQIKIDYIVNKLIKVLAAVALIVFGLALIRGIDFSEALRFVIAMSVSAVPEDLPIAISIILILGMRRMAKRGALVRSMKTMEDIGIVTVVAVDKTGTLTKNNLKVIDSWAIDDKNELSEAIYKSLGDTTSTVEPFDTALLASVQNNKEYGGRLLKNYPFEQSQRISGARWQEASAVYLYVKGSPEHVINLCKMNETERSLAQAQLFSLAARGFRVIAVAKAHLTNELTDLKGIKSINLKFIGLIALADELRPESAKAVFDAKQAGINIIMITGDHYETAFHIGRSLGICTAKDQVIMGSDLPTNIAELAQTIKTKTVFARILPEQKFNILKALKTSEITAMTGDGVNDVPALASADVGIAMGSGNDIAKDTGDILIMDNNFASIIKAVAEGRTIYDNVRRILFYLLSTTLGELLTMIGALVIGLPLPVTAVQILWINLVTDSALVIPLGLEPPEDNHMIRPPRPPRAPILDRMILTRIILVGAVMSAVILITFSYLKSHGYSLKYSQSVAFLMLVAVQWVNAYDARSERQSLFKRLRIRNYKLLIGLTFALIAQALVMFGPLRETFNISALSGRHIFIGAVLPSLLVFITVEIHKVFTRQTKARA